MGVSRQLATELTDGGKLRQSKGLGAHSSVPILTLIDQGVRYRSPSNIEILCKIAAFHGILPFCMQKYLPIG